MRSKSTQKKASLIKTRFRSVAPGLSRPLNDRANFQHLIGNRGLGLLLEGSSNLQPSQARSFQERKAGLPHTLRTGIENLSGLVMNDVTVHYNSSKAAEMQALAHTQGTHIHLGPGQEKHLPHEAWHVVQQKQGRVRATGVRTNGASINADPVLEREADQMGVRASHATFFERIPNSNPLLVSRPAQTQVMQRKEVATNYGKFETTKFKEAEGRGVEIILKFHPDEKKVDAKKIALVQSVKTTLPSGAAYAIDPNTATRMVGSGKSGEGYYIDRLSDKNNPVYGAKSLSATEKLKDTPESANTTTAATEVGTNTNYELGHCFKEKSTDANKKKHSAGLYDKPRSGKNKGRSKTFETTALAIEGADQDTYYGSVSWGYKMEGAEDAPTVTKSDITPVSKGRPSANLVAPAKLWNVAKSQGKLEVMADPEATVKKSDGSTTDKLAKGTKLKQRGTLPWPGGTEPSVKAEVLKTDGTGSGKIIYIKNADVKDIGDGSETKDLPIPADKPAVEPPKKRARK